MLLCSRVLISQTGAGTEILIFDRWSSSSEEFNLKWCETHVLWERVRLLPEPSRFQEYVLECPLAIRLKLELRFSIKFEVSDRLIRFQRGWVFQTVQSPLLIVLLGKFVERVGLLEGWEVVSSENKTWPDRESSTLRDGLRSYDKLVNWHRMALKMLKVKFWPWVVASKYLIVVHHNSANLETLIVRCTLVMIDHEWKEGLLGLLRTFSSTWWMG